MRLHEPVKRRLPLDLDVDGTANSFMRAAMVPERLEGKRRRSIWKVRHEVPRTETEGKFRLGYERPAMWHVVNPQRKNALGIPWDTWCTPRATRCP